MSNPIFIYRLLFSLFALVGGVSLAGQNAFGQVYDLIAPDGRISAMVEVDSSGLLLYERTGEKRYYGRAPGYDSVDNRHFGYFNFQHQHVMRFPRLGFGRIYVANLHDVHPQFKLWPRVAQRIADRTPAQLAGPYSVFIEMKTVPNPPLPPAVTTLVNDGPRDVQVSVVDATNPAGTRTFRIAPGQSQEVELIRDSGAKRVSIYERVSAYGDVTRSRVETDLPPVSRYEVVVHQWAIQSIAIDRTGATPVIEDINRQGKGIGRFWLPPGPELQSGVVGVMSTAKQQGNQGLVAPLLEKPDTGTDSAAILENTVLQIQQQMVDQYRPSKN